MTPDQIDELAQALYACFCPQSKLENAFSNTQELYRNGVRVVLERAGQLGDSARVDAERWATHAETQIARAVAAEKDLVSASEKLAECRAERDDWEQSARGCREEILQLRKVCDEQKARADRAEYAAKLERKCVADWCEAVQLEKARADKAEKELLLIDEWAKHCTWQRERIAAFEKAVEAADRMFGAFPGPVPHQAQAYRMVRAALDAPQPNQDSAPGAAPDIDAAEGERPSVAPAGENTGHPIPDGILIAAAVYECTIMAQKEGGLKTALNASGQFAGLDYGIDLEARLRARKETRSR